MDRLYGLFLREYYRFHHPRTFPGASTVAWDYDYASALGAEQLSTMHTDVTLRPGNHTLIINAKYYSRSMQISISGKKIVHSTNLYRVLTYTKNADVDRNAQSAASCSTRAQKRLDNPT